MIETDLSWKNAEGLKIFTRCWEPTNEPQGVVCLIHGLGEHSGRYTYVAERLLGAGYAVLAPDLPGHGQSDGKRGHTPPLDVLHEDISHIIQMARDRFPGKPVFLYGHSLGGLLSLSLIISRKPDLTGAIVSGLALRTALHSQKLKIAMAKVLGRAFPAITISSGLDPATICTDPKVVYAYTCDPLVHDRISYGLGLLLLKEIDRIFARATKFHLPLLVMHGRHDQLGFVQGCEEFTKLVICDCTVKIWEEMGHEIHNEPGKDQVLDLVTGWLNERVQETVKQLDKA